MRSSLKEDGLKRLMRGLFSYLGRTCSLLIGTLDMMTLPTGLLNKLFTEEEEEGPSLNASAALPSLLSLTANIPSCDFTDEGLGYAGENKLVVGT